MWRSGQWTMERPCIFTQILFAITMFVSHNVAEIHWFCRIVTCCSFIQAGFTALEPVDDPVLVPYSLTVIDSSISSVFST